MLQNSGVMDAAAQLPFHRIDTITYNNFGFRLWRVDTQARPCIGTSEIDSSRGHRSDLEPGEFTLRLQTLSDELEAADVPLGAVAIWYNDSETRSEAYHIKCSVPLPDYQSFLASCGLSNALKVTQLNPCEYEDRFRRDFYADKLRNILLDSESDRFVETEEGACCCLVASPGQLEAVGPFIVSNEPPFSLADCEARVAAFEASIRGWLGREAVWFSVCLFFDEPPVSEEEEEEEEEEEGRHPSRSGWRIGAKVAERRFAQLLLPERKARDEFLRAWTWKNPRRIYDSKPPSPGSTAPLHVRRSHHAGKPAAGTPIACRFFHQRAGCRNGEGCHFVHGGVAPGRADEGAGNDWDFAFDDVETEALAKLKQLQLAPGLPPKFLPKIEKLVAMYKASECTLEELQQRTEAVVKRFPGLTPGTEA
jgi:hypothetical protein